MYYRFSRAIDLHCMLQVEVVTRRRESKLDGSSRAVLFAVGAGYRELKPESGVG